jgi:hypothetical protein
MKKLCILLLTITILAGYWIKTEEETTIEITDISICTTKTTTELTTEATEKSTESETTTEATFYTTTTKTSEIGSKIAFYYDDGEEVYITADEYNEICGVVMNETGYGSYEGCVAVAQAIRNQIIRERSLGHAYDIASVRKTYKEHYTKAPNERVRRAVTDVFYNHIVVTKEPIIAWCAGGSSWHDQQIKVCSYDGNDFYKLR